MVDEKIGHSVKLVFDKPFTIKEWLDYVEDNDISYNKDIPYYNTFNKGDNYFIIPENV